MVKLMSRYCLTAVPDGWLAFTTDGLTKISADGPRLTYSRSITEAVTGESATDGLVLRLHASPDGRFAALVADYGRHAVIIDVIDGSAVLTLDRGDYCTNTTPFPLAFLGAERPVLAAASDWHRLDLFELPTGRLLTARETEWDDEDDPPIGKYVDYFHGALLPSPSGRWLLDNGWYWQPFEASLIYDARTWMGGDRYATERDDNYLLRKCLWDTPAVWIDDNTIAIQRTSESEPGTDGIDIYHTNSADPIGGFDCPAGPIWIYRGVLYIATPQGLQAHRPEDGLQVGFIPDFRPIAHNRFTGAFAELADNCRLRLWTPSR